MTTAATISADLLLDAGEFNKGISSAMKSADVLSSRMKEVGGNIMRIGGAMTAGLTLPILAAGKGMIDAASTLAESANAVNVVFGDAKVVIEDYAKTVAETAGLSQAEFNQISAVTGAFLKNVGFTTEEAANQTITLTERAADMASIFNTDVSQALAAMQSGLKGEFNPLEQFGVKMNADAIAAKALALGLAPIEKNQTKINEALRKYEEASAKVQEVASGMGLKISGALLKVEEAQGKVNEATKKYGADSLEARKAVQKLEEARQKLNDLQTGGPLADAQAKLTAAQEKLNLAMEGSVGPLTDEMKAQAALALIMEQTNQFAGDFVNTSDGLANSSKILKAQFTDLSAELGTQLLPIGLKIVQFISDLVAKFNALTPAQQKTILIFAAIVAAIGPAVTIIGGLVTAVGALSSPLLLIVAVLSLLYFAWVKNWGGIQDKFVPAIQSAIKWTSKLKTWFEDLTPGQRKLLVVMGAVTLGIILLVVGIGRIKPAIENATKSLNPFSGGILGLIFNFAKFISAAAIVVKVLGFLGVATGPLGAGIVGLNVAIAGLGTTILSTLASVLLPVIAIFLAIAAGVALLYLAWKTNFLGIQDTVKLWVNVVTTLFQAFKAALSGDWTQFGVLLRQAWDLVWNEIERRLGNALVTLTNIGEGIVNGIRAVFTIDWSNLGSNIIDGIISGLSNGIENVIAMAEAVAQAASDAISGFLGIQSPSKLMFEYGLMTAQGFADGMAAGGRLNIPKALGLALGMASKNNRLNIPQALGTGRAGTSGLDIQALGTGRAKASSTTPSSASAPGSGGKVINISIKANLNNEGQIDYLAQQVAKRITRA